MENLIVFSITTLLISMKRKNKKLISLEEFKEKHFGKHGTTKRDELESGYDAFKIEAMNATIEEQ